MAPSIILKEEAEFEITASQCTYLFSEEALDGDVDLSGLTDDSPVLIW